MAENGGSTPTPAQASAKAPKKILVINHTDSPYRLPIMDPGQGKEPRPSVESTVTLLPGANAVDPDAWDIVREYPIAKALIKKKHRGGFEVGDPRVDVRNLDSFRDEEEALELIDMTVDPDLLKGWLRSEKRPALLTALEEQMAKIDPRRDPLSDDEKDANGKAE